MSENVVRDLHVKLSDKLIEEASVIKSKGSLSKQVELSHEIIKIRNSINDELDRIKGVKKQPVEFDE